jgi:hypothetical protein
MRSRNAPPGRFRNRSSRLRQPTLQGALAHTDDLGHQRQVRMTLREIGADERAQGGHEVPGVAEAGWGCGGISGSLT